MPGDAGLEAPPNARREVALELGREVRILGDIGRDEARRQVDLRIREHDRVLRAREADAGLLPLVKLVLARQTLEPAIEVRLRFEHPDQGPILAEALRGARAHDRK